MKLNKKVLISSVVALALCGGTTAYATTSVSVSANKKGSCSSIDITQQLEFGEITQNDANATAILSMDCNKNTTINNISISAGSNNDDVNNRVMRSAGNTEDTLKYQIYKPIGALLGVSPSPGSCTGATDIWGTTLDTDVFKYPTDSNQFKSSGAKSINICGKIASTDASAAAAALDYSDSVTITVTYS